jgi:ABC-type multidrug transport system fused ATPase/permease subunit
VSTATQYTVIDQIRAVVGGLSQCGDEGCALAIVQVVGLLWVGAVSKAASVGLIGSAGVRVIAQLKVRLFTAIIRRPVSFFDVEPTGSLGATLDGDVDSVKHALSSSAVELVQNMLQIGLGLLMMLQTSVELTTVTVAVVPVLGFLSSFMGNHVRGLAKRNRMLAGAAAALALETMSAIRTVKLFGREGALAAKYAAKIAASASGTHTKWLNAHCLGSHSHDFAKESRLKAE